MGPNMLENTATGEIAYEDGPDAEPLKGREFRIAFTNAMGGFYDDPMVARDDVFAYFTHVVSCTSFYRRHLVCDLLGCSISLLKGLIHRFAYPVA